MITFSDGRRRLFRGQIIRPAKTNSGYWQIRMKRNERVTYEYIHRLVARAFIPNPKGLPEVNHKDENRLNNCVDNLEWTDRIGNLTYGNRTKKFAVSRGYKVGQFTQDGKQVHVYYSTRDAGRHGYDQTCVSKCALGKLKTYKGYIWRYL